MKLRSVIVLATIFLMLICGACRGIPDTLSISISPGDSYIEQKTIIYDQTCAGDLTELYLYVNEEEYAGWVSFEPTRYEETISCGESREFTVTFTIPPETPIGLYQLSITAGGSTDIGGGSSHVQDVTIRVGGVIPPTSVGGEVFPVNKMNILIPWIALAAVITLGGIVLIRRRILGKIN